jgi:hypothetical protein
MALRQQKVNKSFLLMYLCKNAALGQILTNYVALLWLADGQSLSRKTIRNIPST